MRPKDDCLRVWHEPGDPESSRTSADVYGGVVEEGLSRRSCWVG